MRLINVTFLCDTGALVQRDGASGYWNVLSRLSPLHRSSSIFFVMILVTSCNSLFKRSMPPELESAAAVAVRVSRYSRAVLDMNVSNAALQE